MRRTKTITTNDSNTKAKVTIWLDSPFGGLTRDEQDSLLRSLASGVMNTLASARYLNVHLSDIKVSK